jgi:hypothetical protein
VACAAYYKEKLLLVSLAGDQNFYLVDYGKSKTTKSIANPKPESIPLKLIPLSAILASSQPDSHGLISEARLDASSLFLLVSTDSLSLVDLREGKIR